MRTTTIITSARSVIYDDGPCALTIDNGTMFGSRTSIVFDDEAEARRFLEMAVRATQHPGEPQRFAEEDL